MAISYSPTTISDTSAYPLIGQLANSLEANCLKMALNDVAGLTYGDPLVVLVADARYKIQNANAGFNPNTQTINAKATTETAGANTTNCCGFLTFNAVDVVTDGKLPLPQKGEMLNYAPLGQGALIWLEVASANQSGFQAKLDTNVGIGLDGTNGGVKVGSGTNVLPGAKVVQGLTKCRKIKADGTLADCVGVLVQLD